MVGILILLLAAGLFYQFGEINKQKSKKVSLKKQVISDLVPAMQKKPVPATLGNTPPVKPETVITSQPVPPAPAAPVASKAHKPFSIQVKSVPSSEEAGRIVGELKGEGQDAFSRRVKVKGRGEWNRIFVGHFESKEEAGRFIRTHKLETKYPGGIVQKMPEDD